MVKNWLAVAAVCSSFLFPPAFVHAENMQVGQMIGEVLSTDIRAYVNGNPIPSMNIGGYTAVAVEDLRQYGFDVAWSPYARKLTVSESPGKSVLPLPAATAAASAETGTKIGDVLSTDIRAYYDGKELRSFNMDGRTAILLNDLEAYGTVTWNQAQRTISFQAAGYVGERMGDAAKESGPAFKLTQTSDIAMTVDFKGEQLYDGDQQIGYGENGLPYFSLDHFARKFGFGLSHDGNRYTVDEGLYSFEVSAGSKAARVYWGGEADHNVEMYREPQEKDGHLYVYSIDMERLFGYTGLWNQEERKLDIQYGRYDVQDYGLPAYIGGDGIQVKGLVSEKRPRNSATERMVLSLNNMDLYGNQGIAYFSSAAANAEGMYASMLDSAVSAALGDNQVQARIAIGERILYKADYAFGASFNDVPFKVSMDGFTLDGMERGIVRTSTRNFDFTGTAPEGFTVDVKKWVDGKGFVQNILEKDIHPDASNQFQMPVYLSEGNGLYRVSISTSEMRPRAGMVRIEAGYFYIMSLQP